MREEKREGESLGERRGWFGAGNRVREGNFDVFLGFSISGNRFLGSCRVFLKFCWVSRLGFGRGEREEGESVGV